jgi:putative phosphoesterase
MAVASSETRALRVGIISDTHGLFDPRLETVFAGVDRILHAGDVGAVAVLDNLAAIAPVTAVRGNVDHDVWAWELPQEAVVELNGRRLLVAHIKEDLLRHRDPEGEGFSAVVIGHSHAPAIVRRGGVLYLNPGSAGRRRFHLPRAVALLTVPADPCASLEAEIVILEEGSKPAR